MSWQDDLKKIEQVFHQKLRTDATFEWLYTKVIEDANNSEDSLEEIVDGMITLGRHVALHAQYPIAVKLFEKTLEMVEKRMGIETLYAGKLCDSMSYSLMMQGRYNEALSTMERWVSATEGKCDKTSPDYREILTHYCEVIYRAGKTDQAAQLTKQLMSATPEKDPLGKVHLENLARYEKPYQKSFDPADNAQLLREEMLHGSPASLESLRQAVLEVVVKQALVGAPWRELCKGPMEINGISESEIEAEVVRRRAPAQS